MTTVTKVSWSIAGAILLVAWQVASRDDRRLVELERTASGGVDRHSQPEVGRVVKPPDIVEVDAAGIPIRWRQGDRSAKARKNALELLDWFGGFSSLGEPGAKKDPKALLQVQRAILEMSATDAAIILEEILEGRGPSGYPRPYLFNQSLVKLATERPLAALELFSEFRAKWPTWASESGSQIVGDAMIAMAKDNPAGMVAWLHGEGKSYHDHIPEHGKRVALHSVATKDPALAFQLLADLRLGPGGEAVAAITRAARTQEEKERMLAALRGYRKTVDGSMQGEVTARAFKGFADQLMKEGADAASRWVGDTTLDAAEKDALVDGMSGLWWRNDTGKWLEWMSSTASPGHADAEIRKQFTTWAQEDYRAAGEWLANLPQGDFRNLSARAYAEAAAKYDPETAVLWAAGLPPGEARESTLRKIHEDWPRDAPEDARAAEAFAERHGLR